MVGMEVLEKILGNSARVKIMRLFLFNPTETFDVGNIAERSKVSEPIARKEVLMMEKVGLVKKHPFVKEITSGHGKKQKKIRRRVVGWKVNESFDYLDSLQNLLIQISPLRNGDLLERLRKVGKLKLVIVSGLFINNWDSRIDLLIVGDLLRKGALENTVKIIESEIGREIRYTFFETADFQYRLGIYDKLIRDILDFPHEKILNKINLSISR